MMRTFSPTFAAMLVAASLAMPPAAAEAQQPALSAADTEKVKSEVTATLDLYYSLFSQRNAQALPEQVFNVPWIVLGGNGPRADMTKEQAQAGFEASMKNLVESGWAKSVFTTESVCVLNANAAIASGYNTRYKTDGSVMSVGGVSYLLGRSKDGWRIISYSGHPKGKLVRCD